MVYPLELSGGRAARAPAGKHRFKRRPPFSQSGAQLLVRSERTGRIDQRLMRVRKLINRLIARTGYAIAKIRDCPHFTESRVFRSMVSDNADPATIFDIGANIGQSAAEFAREFPQSSIYAWEPFQETFAHLCQQVKPFTNVRPLKLAAGNRIGLQDVLREREAASQVNSLVEARQASLKNQGAAETIEMMTVDRFCQQNHIESIDILKTDTEGYDLEVLQGATGLLERGRVRAVVCETGMDNDVCHTRFFEVAAFLRTYQFAAVGFYDTDYQSDGRFSHTNSLFVSRRGASPFLDGSRFTGSSA